MHRSARTVLAVLAVLLAHAHAAPLNLDINGKAIVEQVRCIYQ